jgi:hypothetical protein
MPSLLSQKYLRGYQFFPETLCASWFPAHSKRRRCRRTPYRPVVMPPLSKNLRELRALRGYQSFPETLWCSWFPAHHITVGSVSIRECSRGVTGLGGKGPGLRLRVKR